MKKYTLFAMILAALVFTGCDREQVPAGYKGKVLTSKGWKSDIYPPSMVHVDKTFTTIPEKLYLVETTTRKYVQPIEVVLADKLTLSANIIFTGRIVNDKKILNFIFNDMPVTDKDRKIQFDEVYNTYGKMIVLNTSRDVISKYNVDNINKNYGRITKQLYNELTDRLKGSPIQIDNVTIGDIKYPKTVTDAINRAKERRMKIEEAKAQVQIDLEKARGQEEVSKAMYRVKMMEAKRIRDYNKMIQSGITSNLLELRKLEVQEKLADSIKENKNVIYMPFDMMTNTTYMKNIK